MVRCVVYLRLMREHFRKQVQIGCPDGFVAKNGLQTPQLMLRVPRQWNATDAVHQLHN